MAAELRPTFAFDVDRPPAGVLASLHAAFGAPGSAQRPSGAPDLEVRWAGPHLLLTHARRHRRFFSPWLHIDVREHEPAEHAGTPAAGSRVFARFSPHPNLWTCYALGYLALGSVSVLAACFAGAQMFLAQPPWAWWIVIVSLLIAGVMWIGAIVGQRASHAQMVDLHGRLLRAAGQTPAPADDTTPVTDANRRPRP